MPLRFKPQIRQAETATKFAARQKGMVIIMEIAFHSAQTLKPKYRLEEEAGMGFCKRFTDYMFLAEYDKGIGWHDARIIPYGPLSVDPASPVFHYGQEIFEGLKAYRRVDGQIALFRPEQNAQRMNRSAERIRMAEIPVDLQLAAMNALVDVERDWVPHSDDTSLYLRPTLIADGNKLGVHAADRYLYYIICSPCGSYYPSGLAPVRMRIERDDVRAVRGGVGFAKTGGNYAASMRAGEAAIEAGFNQALWLDGVERKYVEEAGAMNVMFVINGVVTTPALSGSILPGVTRDSVLTLARDMGMKAEERRISVDELIEAADSGALTESFCTGTAACVTPISEYGYGDRLITLNRGETGPVARAMYQALSDIQRGRASDPHGWITIVKGK